VLAEIFWKNLELSNEKVHVDLPCQRCLFNTKSAVPFLKRLQALHLINNLLYVIDAIRRPHRQYFERENKELLISPKWPFVVYTSYTF